MWINSKLTELWRGAAPAASTRKRNVNGTRKRDMAKSDRDLGRLEEGLRTIRETLAEQNNSRRQLYEKVDAIDTKVTRLETAVSSKIDTMEKDIQALKTPVTQFQTQQHEEAGARKYRGFLMFVLGAIASTVLGAAQFIKSLF